MLMDEAATVQSSMVSTQSKLPVPFTLAALMSKRLLCLPSAVSPRHNGVTGYVRLLREETDRLQYGMQVTVTVDCKIIKSEGLVAYFGL